MTEAIEIDPTPAGPAARRLLSLDEPAAADPARAGHKAATLARLRAAGHRVPPGVVLPVELAGRLREAPAAEALPGEVVAELAAALEELGGGPVAVRSSGIAEDLPGASWAGQYDSVLGVSSVEALLEAVGRCAASAASERAVAYGREYAFERGAPAGALAVLVQWQVPAEAAGVAFTANPVTGDDEALVSAVRGLGDRLAAGEVTPEDWVVRPGAAPERTAGPEAVLDAAEAARVAELARGLAAELGTPCDVEWALAGGVLHLLQARPITALPVRPELVLPTAGTWTKDTSHYADPLTPLAETFYMAPLDAAVTEMARTYGLLIDGLESRCLGGELYTRAIPPGGKDGPAPPWWLLGLLARIAPPLRRKLRAARAAFAADLPARALARWSAEWRPELERRIADLAAEELPAFDRPALRRHLERVQALLVDGQRIHFLLFLPYLLALHDLVRAAEELLGWGEADALGLVGGLSGTTSAPARDLQAVAAAVGRVPAARELLAGWAGAPLPEVVAGLRAAGAPETAARLEAHLERFGCRVTGYDPGRPTLAERPELLLGLLRDLVREGASPDSLTAALEARRAAADAAMARALDERGAPPEDRERMAELVARAREVWPVREENLFYTDSVPCGLLRRAAMEIGRRLVAAGALRHADDACWLEAEELWAVLDGGDHAEAAAVPSAPGCEPTPARRYSVRRPRRRPTCAACRRRCGAPPARCSGRSSASSRASTRRAAAYAAPRARRGATPAPYGCS